MPFRQPISDEQLAPFLEAAKLMMIPADDVPPLVVEAIPEPYASQNETILAMHQALIAEAIKMNTNNAKEYEERKELWYRETAIAAYLDAKKKADEAEAKRKAEEAAAKKAAEEENERTIDANSEGEDEVDQDETPKSKKKSKSRPIVDSESEEETEEVKYTRNTVPVDYTGCPGIPVRKMCEGCKVPANAKYQRPCMGDVLMDVNDKIFYVRSKNRCFVCLMRNNVCSFTREDKADFIMPEATDDEELQAKLRKLCDEQDVFKTQKDKERAERNKLLGNSTKAGTKKTVQVNTKASGSNAKASGSTPKGSKRKVVSEEDDIVVETRPKRARTATNSTGSNERIPSVAESLHGINQALIQTVTIFGDNRDANERQAQYLRGIETCMVNLQFAMQTHVQQVHSRLGELERRAEIWPMEDEEYADEEVVPAELEDMEEEVEEVCEEVEEVCEEVEEVCEEVEEVCEEVEEVCEEVEEVCEEVEEVCEEVEEVCEEVEEVHEEDKGGHEVEDDETMKDPEADEL
ncbi:hypothetical protein M422DRAFT_275834 [Sphaerobolus stellatus SS14]|uniref:Uncharacterized protein n=1 Tax=Sphaerobolus stellatus (strain SS14) TaxID=990650 RepID=A0A0C9UEE0_SPHS4|nr:hypothetical protein M422DRAFT_275834 [Sphaerobolus stellatus SS14]